MLYTRKGDGGTTKTFGCDQRISKSSAIAEALGSLDETNSFLGLCKAKARESNLFLDDEKIDVLVHEVQKNLFIVQAELAGASMNIEEEKVKEVESVVDRIEKKLPPVKTFFISGASELSALFDVARTISRRAERRVVAVMDAHDGKGQAPVSAFTLAYLNRLSSLLYAFARLANLSAGINEESPDYK